MVHGHLLAAEKISRKIPFSAFLNRTGPIAKTLTRRRIPTSERNPEEETTETDLPLAVYRNRFDQFAPASLEEAAGENGPEELSVAGSAFFITGGEPIHFWDFAQAIWYEYDGHINTKTSVWVFPKMLALWLASMAMLWAKLMRKPSAFTPEKVLYATSIRWFNIERARIMLDYEPVVGVEEGIKRGVAVSEVFCALQGLADVAPAGSGTKQTRRRRQLRKLSNAEQTVDYDAHASQYTHPDFLSRRSLSVAHPWWYLGCRLLSTEYRMQTLWHSSWLSATELKHHHPLLNISCGPDVSVAITATRHRSSLRWR